MTSTLNQRLNLVKDTINPCVMKCYLYQNNENCTFSVIPQHVQLTFKVILTFKVGSIWILLVSIISICIPFLPLNFVFNLIMASR